MSALAEWGLAIIFEGKFRVGDWVETGNFSGSVADIGIRTTKLTENPQIPMKNT